MTDYKTNRKTRKPFPMLTTPLTQVVVPIKDNRGLYLNSVEDVSVIDPKAKVNRVHADKIIDYILRHGFHEVANRIYYPSGFAPRREIWFQDDRGRMLQVTRYLGKFTSNLIESSIEYSDTPIELKKPTDETNRILAAGHEKSFEGKPLTLYDVFSLGYSGTFKNQVGTLRKWVEQ